MIQRTLCPLLLLVSSCFPQLQTDKITAGVTPAGTDASVWNVAQRRFGFASNRGGIWNSTFMYRQDETSSQSAYESGALFIKAVTNDDDVNHVGRDVVGFDSNGETLGGTKYARVWGGLARFTVNSGSDGQGIGLETDLINNGADQNQVPGDTGVYNAKIGYWLASAGAAPSTAYIATAIGGPGTHHGIVLRNIVAGGDALAIPNNIPIVGHSATSNNYVSLLYLDTSNVVQIGNSAVAVHTPVKAYLDGGAIVGELKVGQGSIINAIYNASMTLSFTSIAAHSSQNQVIRIVGVTAANFGAFCSPRSSLGDTDISWSAWVSAPDTLTVRLTNPTTHTINPARVTWGCTVSQ
jgi:hypothetical protein